MTSHVTERLEKTMREMQSIRASSKRDETVELLRVPISKLVPDERNHRVDLGNKETHSARARKKFLEIVSSIKAEGLHDPIKVQRLADGERFLISGGHRRYFACLEAGLTEVNVLVTALRDPDLSVAQLVSNIMQERPNPCEIALAIQASVDAKVPREHIASAVGKSDAWISRHLRILSYPEPLQRVMRDGLVRNLNVADALTKLPQTALERHIAAIDSGVEFIIRGNKLARKSDETEADELSPTVESPTPSAVEAKRSKRAKPLIIEFSPEQAERVLRHLERESPAVLEAAILSINRALSEGIPDRSQNAKSFRKLFVAAMEKLAPGIKSPELTSAKANGTKPHAYAAASRPAGSSDAQA